MNSKTLTPVVTNAIRFFGILVFGLAVGMISRLSFSLPSLSVVMPWFIAGVSIVIIGQCVITLCWMLYSWDSEDSLKKIGSPHTFCEPHYSFSALVPVRHEAAVIGDTLTSLATIHYPSDRMEVIVIARYDDIDTIHVIEETIKKLGTTRMKLIRYQDDIINKPHALNIGRKYVQGDVIMVFDAEDEPHPDIYNVVNTKMITTGADVLQSGVQLMNYQSRWFSLINVLEYFFWFRSGLSFFTHVGGVTPLGGNTVAVKTPLLTRINGWDESCLTEDADLGIRLAARGAAIDVIYDEKYVTREETPLSLAHFINQRTRWIHGFIQIFLKGNWMMLPRLPQQLMVIYILLSQVFQTVFFLYTPVNIWLSYSYHLPIVVSMLSIVPLYFLFLQLIVGLLGLVEFSRAYRKQVGFITCCKLVLSFYPYQLVLVYATIRAVIRLATSRNAWEKTLHLNMHREEKLLGEVSYA